MAKFSMTIDDLEIHRHSPTAHRAFIGQMLDHASQAVRSGLATEGNLVSPAMSPALPKVVGSWKIEGEL
ncbi:hypothetical protein [Bradyrhizobium cytisi]|uniref:Uncharacterized protein n=1 Tax=Bradyrhizobium cytisi TaxID=515489 RepID=A0A5S4X249_9BRAD|nr:hypothetical protein [Bradyrhizobium cytisi]TYL83618.1 hypothetical protein FXB38_18150 [Bradyrhizobium cytisi]